MNLKSLASDLGMSKTTVSRALNGYPEVNKVTRARVLAAARAAGYEANPLARSLAMGRTNVFGIIYPVAPGDLGDPMFLSIVGGMTAALEESQRKLIIAPVSARHELPAYEHMVRGKRVDGLVVSRTLVHDTRIAYLISQGFPFVAHGRTELAQPYAWFDVDNEAGISMACQHLLAYGHQRIAMMSAPLAFNFASQRRTGFVHCMQQAGLATDPAYLIDNIHDRRAGYQAMQQLLACSPQPTAVIVDNHLSGVGAVRALLDAGVAIGNELSVIVWGSNADSLVGSNVTIIDQPDGDQAGAKMMAMLDAIVEGADPGATHELCQPLLVAGASTGPCQP